MCATKTDLGILSLQHAGWGAPASEDIAANLDTLVDWTDRELSNREGVDLVVLPELSTTPYFCGSRDDRYFKWAELIPGPTTARFGELARRYRTNIVVPLFERSSEGLCYNSAAVIDSDGQLVQGHPNDVGVAPYRKCHVPTIQNPPDTEAWEDHFFQPGSGFPVFRVARTTIGVLICYDRWFPEAWRLLVDSGAEIVVVPMVAWGFVEGPYLPMLQTRAAENGVFVVSCNRAGLEELDGVRMQNFGRSTIVGPDGTVVAGAAPGEAQTAIFATINLGKIEEQRRVLPLLAHRRRDLYGQPSEWISVKARRNR